jgi:DNA-binding XRE family transcriptional regulator
MSTVSRELAKPLNALSLYGYRRTLRLSQAEAARLAGVSKRQLQRLEAETVVTPTAVRLATTYLGAYLLAGSNGKEAA